MDYQYGLKERLKDANVVRGATAGSLSDHYLVREGNGMRRMGAVIRGRELGNQSTWEEWAKFKDIWGDARCV